MCLESFVGQRSTVQQIRTALLAYRNSKTPNAFPHCLYSGPSGVGKTTLAELLASEIGSNLQVELAQNIQTPQSAMAALLDLEPNSILFLDEIHELPIPVSVLLYRCLEERKLFIGKRQIIQLPPFTLIGATTHEFMLEKSFRQRFKLVFRLNYYSVTELSSLLQQKATVTGWTISNDSAQLISELSRGTPRTCFRLWEGVVRVAQAQGANHIDPSICRQMLEIDDLDNLGLDPIERQYLRILGEFGDPIRLNVIASQMGLPRKSVEMLEDDLIRLGLLTKSDHGRLLTPFGASHLSNSIAGNR